MFYRRKIILALIESFNNEIHKVSLEKLLFIFTRYQEKPAFDFVPYQISYYSFQYHEDLRIMLVDKLIYDAGNSWQKTGDTSYVATLKPKDKQVLLYVLNKFGKSTPDELDAFITKNYPFPESATPGSNTVLYTIGYEGISLEKYIHTLILNNITLLCDVRKNAFSMKYGFSKATLQAACQKLGIQYVHIPALGIDSDKRKSMQAPTDRDDLFNEYEKITLEENLKSVTMVLDLLKENKRMALTCFEAHYCDCHRGILSEVITRLPEWKYELIHL